MPEYKTPGVFTEEVTTLPPTVVPVATAIPAFIGFTEKKPTEHIEPIRVDNFLDFQELFGGAYAETFSAEVDINPDSPIVVSITKPNKPTFHLYYQLKMFFFNGGGSCYIVSVGTFNGGSYTPPSVEEPINDGIAALERTDVPTMILIPDAVKTLSATASPSSRTRYYGFYNNALTQSQKLKNRMTLIDTHNGDQERGLLDENGIVGQFRTGIGTENLSYGATYYPWLETTLNYHFIENQIAINGATHTNTVLRYDTNNLELLSDDPDATGPFADEEAKRTYYEERSLYHIDGFLYNQIKSNLEELQLRLPPSGAVAGIYAQVDRTVGVFKSPANISISGVVRPSALLNRNQTDELNVHSSGKSVNVIRPIKGRGKAVVMGGRTLDGNSNEWRYISVRRFFIFAETSIQKAVEAFVFEPNTPDTWNLLRGMIENFLNQQWLTGALVGATAKQAYDVRVGQGETMTPQDILNGRLILEVGLATVRPAEFIILKFSHQLQQL